jgi:hypothetical protein
VALCAIREQLVKVVTLESRASFPPPGRSIWWRGVDILVVFAFGSIGKYFLINHWLPIDL